MLRSGKMAGKGKNEPVIRYEDLPENLQKKVRQQLEREKRSSLGYRLGQLLRGGGKERPESGKEAAPAAASPAAEKEKKETTASNSSTRHRGA